MLRVLNHVSITEECSPEHDRSSLPGCSRGFRDGFCCRGCNWRRDRPITIGNHSSLLLDYALSPAPQPVPFHIYEEAAHLTTEAVYNMHTTARMHATRHARKKTGMRLGAEAGSNDPITDVFTLASALVREQKHQHG